MLWVIGSGCSYLYGFLDQAWQPNMSREDAKVQLTYICVVTKMDY
jgi:20S proteasome alpha/beta subunit